MEAKLRSSRLEMTPAYAVGTELKVVYFAGKLDEGQIKNEIMSTWTNLFTGLVGLLMIAAMLGLRLMKKFFSIR